MVLAVDHEGGRAGDHEEQLLLVAPGLIVTSATKSSYATGPFGEMMLRHHLTPRLGKPEPYQYASDNQSAVIPDALPVQVRETNKGKKGDRNIHLARVNGQLTYFIDCGQPLGAQ